MMPPIAWLPIDESARDGRPRLVRNGDARATARWNGESWIYPGTRAPTPLDFEPDEYAE